MTRLPVVAGTFYEKNPKLLLNQIEKCFLSPFGPGKLPDLTISPTKHSSSKSKSKKIIGAISPHAGYFYSGPCASWTYKAISESKKPDTFIILAPNHSGLGRTSLVTENYETPLGEINIDVDLAKELLKNCKGLIEDIGSHINEHSLEVQLPFLQYLYKNYKSDLKIVPIVLSSPFYCMDIADGISKTIENYEKQGKSVCLIASSDFTHYGPNYEYQISKDNIKENIKNLDFGAIEKILNNDYKGFLKYIGENNATICGYLPIGVMLKALEKKIKEAKLLKYYLSSDIVSDKENSVSYASIVFYG